MWGDIFFNMSTIIQEKVGELAKTVKELNQEAQRLRNNLDRMHKLQSTLYQTDLRLIEWLETGNKLKDIHIPLGMTFDKLKQQVHDD